MGRPTIRTDCESPTNPRFDDRISPRPPDDYLPRLAILEGLVRRRLLLLQPGDTLGHGACNPCTHIFQGKNRSGD
jgi:hypothetical protein